MPFNNRDLDLVRVKPFQHFSLSQSNSFVCRRRIMLTAKRMSFSKIYKEIAELAAKHPRMIIGGAVTALGAGIVSSSNLITNEVWFLPQSNRERLDEASKERKSIIENQNSQFQLLQEKQNSQFQQMVYLDGKVNDLHQNVKNLDKNVKNLDKNVKNLDKKFHRLEEKVDNLAKMIEERK